MFVVRPLGPNTCHYFPKSWFNIPWYRSFSTGMTLPVTTPGTFGNVWAHFWLSPLGGGVCSWHLVGRGQGRCYLTSVPHNHELFELIKLSSSVTGTLSCLSTSHFSSLTEPDFLSPPHLYDMDWASSGQWAATITLWRSTWLDMGTDAHRVAQQDPAHPSLPPPHVHLFLSTGQQ